MTVRSQAKTSLPLWATVLLFALGYLACAGLGRFLSLNPHKFVAFWLPSGLYVATLLLQPRRAWPWFVGAAVAANLTFDLLNGQRALLSLCFCAGNSLEALAGAWLVQRFVSPRPSLTSAPEVLGLLFFSALLSTTLSATIGATTLTQFAGAPSFGGTWLAWWVGDIAGITLMAPLVLGWVDKLPHLRPRFSLARMVEGLGLLLAVVVASWFAIQGELKWNIGLKYLVFPLFGWAAFRFEVRGVSLCALAVALVFVPVLSADLRHSEPGNLPPAVILLITQAFLVFTASVGLLLAAGLAERRRAANDLHESERRFRGLFDHSMAGVALHEIVTDDAGKPVDYVFLMVNSAFEAQSGLASQNIVGQPITKVLPSITEAPFIETYGKVALTGEPIRFEHYVPQLERHFDICAFSPAPGQFATVFFDITQRKQTEAALQARNEELVRFTYTVSHDLKSPLVTIQTFLGFLEKDIQAADPARIETDLGHIRAAGSKMARLLDELLELSRIGRKANPPESAPLQKIVAEALDLVAGRIAQRHIRVRVTDLPVRLHGDLARLVELYQNLIDNAAKFMGDQSDPCIEIGATSSGGEVTLFVRDNGLGIDPRHRHKLFGLFEKLHPGTEGTGIGLALVKRIVEVHGGRISVESAGLGQGTTFRFTLAKTTLALHASPST